MAEVLHLSCFKHKQWQTYHLAILCFQFEVICPQWYINAMTTTFDCMACQSGIWQMDLDLFDRAKTLCLNSIKLNCYRLCKTCTDKHKKQNNRFFYCIIFQLRHWGLDKDLKRLHFYQFEQSCLVLMSCLDEINT